MPSTWRSCCRATVSRSRSVACVPCDSCSALLICPAMPPSSASTPSMEFSGMSAWPRWTVWLISSGVSEVYEFFMWRVFDQNGVSRLYYCRDIPIWLETLDVFFALFINAFLSFSSIFGEGGGSLFFPFPSSFLLLLLLFLLLLLLLLFCLILLHDSLSSASFF